MNARSLAELNAPAALDSGLEALGVTVEVGGKTLLQAASARFAAGEVTAILGPNGAGKSTLMSVLTGQRQPSAGEVRLGGQALADYPNAALARLRAFVAQETQVAFDFTAQEVVELGRYPHRRQPSAQEPSIVLQAMEQAAVAPLRHRALNTLSGGEKARVHLARALAQVWEPVIGVDGEGGVHAPRWLLLDEPTAALDLLHQHRMLALARSRAHAHGLGVVAVLHDLNLALRYSDRCVVLQSGQVLASGLTAGVLTPGCIRQVWGVSACPVLAVEPEVEEGLFCGWRGLQYVFGPAPTA